MKLLPSRRGVLRGGGALALSAGLGSALTSCSTAADDGVGPDGRVTIEMWHGQTDTAREGPQEAGRRLPPDPPGHPGRPGRRCARRRDAAEDHRRARLGLLSRTSPTSSAPTWPASPAARGRRPDRASWRRADAVAQLLGAGPRGGHRQRPGPRGRPRCSTRWPWSTTRSCSRRPGSRCPTRAGPGHDFIDTAQQLTDAGERRFGTGWPGTGDEDTVWRLWPMLWDLGGDVIARRTGAASGSRTRACARWKSSGTWRRDKSVYLDPKPGSEQMYQVFLSGRMGMVPTGPWQLPDITEAERRLRRGAAAQLQRPAR